MPGIPTQCTSTINYCLCKDVINPVSLRVPSSVCSVDRDVENNEATSVFKKLLLLSICSQEWAEDLRSSISHGLDCFEEEHYLPQYQSAGTNVTQTSLRNVVLSSIHRILSLKSSQHHCWLCH